MLVKSADFIYLDLEHGFRDTSQITSAILLLNSIGKDYAVRVRRFDDPLIQTLADHNVRNVIVPQIRNRHELEALKKALNFPPIGVRGLHPRSKLMRKEGDSGHVSITVIIETKESLSLIDYFANDPQVTALYLGVYDLSQELEISTGPASPEFDKYFMEVFEACNRTNKDFGAMLPANQQLEYLIERGVNLFVIGVDLSLLNSAILDRISNIRSN